MTIQKERKRLLIYLFFVFTIFFLLSDTFQQHYIFLFSMVVVVLHTSCSQYHCQQKDRNILSIKYHQAPHCIVSILNKQGFLKFLFYTSFNCCLKIN